jgi:hypothetical protein
MANWFHRFFNPHCPHCAEEKRELKFCQSCEDHKMEISRLHQENDRLLEKILNPTNKTEPERTVAPIPMSPIPSAVPWRVKRQMLEAEDRQKAALLRNAPKPSEEDSQLLEKELKEVQENREHGQESI